MAKNEANTQSKQQAKAMALMKGKKKKEKRSIKEYLKGVKLEMKKVVWPTKNELGSYTVIVIATCIFFAVAFWLIDTGFLAILREIMGIKL